MVSPGAPQSAGVGPVSGEEWQVWSRMHIPREVVSVTSCPPPGMSDRNQATPLHSLLQLQPLLNMGLILIFHTCQPFIPFSHQWSHSLPDFCPGPQSLSLVLAWPPGQHHWKNPCLSCTACSRERPPAVLGASSSLRALFQATDWLLPSTASLRTWSMTVI